MTEEPSQESNPVSAADPNVSAILLSHNCSEVIAAALHSVLGQDCEPMEVIVSDDASGDATYTILQREIATYKGPHKITLRRRDTNSGSKSAHLNDIFPLASGQFLVSFDGDDIAEPHRVRKILAAFLESERVSAVYSDYSYMDEAGRATGRRGVLHPPIGTDPRHWFARVDAYASGATLAVRRDVVETFGPLDPKINEDVVLPFRASLLGDVRFIDQDLVRVRRWEGSLTAAHERFISIDRYRAWLLRGIAQARRQLESRIEDLRKAEQLKLIQPEELEELEQIAVASMAEAEASAGLASPSLLVRMRCFARLAWSGSHPEDLPQNAFVTLAPRLYLSYKRRKL